LLCNYNVIVKFNYISNVINYNFTITFLYINYKSHSIIWKNVINYNPLQIHITITITTLATTVKISFAVW